MTTIKFCARCGNDKKFSSGNAICNSCKNEFNKQRLEKQKHIDFSLPCRQCAICKQVKLNDNFIKKGLECEDCRHDRIKLSADKHAALRANCYCGGAYTPSSKERHEKTKE